MLGEKTTVNKPVNSQTGKLEFWWIYSKHVIIKYQYDELVFYVHFNII